jgi:hypothetical protein
MKKKRCFFSDTGRCGESNLLENLRGQDRSEFEQRRLEQLEREHEAGLEPAIPSRVLSSSEPTYYCATCRIAGAQRGRWEGKFSRGRLPMGTLGTPKSLAPHAH